MKKTILAAFLMLLGSSSVWASIIGSTNPGDFPDTVNWCQSGFGCAGQPLATPTAWTSAGGETGFIGLNNTGENFYNLQQDVSFYGNFSPSMGLIYNGAYLSNIPTEIVATTDQGVFGIGAYIQATYYGAFTATITLFDSNFDVLGSFSANGNSSGANDGSALFIGAYDNALSDVYAAQFSVVDAYNNVHGQDFVIGTMGLATTVPAPEPVSLLLMVSGLLTMAVFARRRNVCKTNEVI